MPQLPDQFTTFLEINISERNETIARMEYYDLYAKKMKIEHVRNGEFNVFLEDGTTETGYVIQDHRCHTINLRDRPDYLQLRKVSDLFHFGAGYNETYLGVADVRGVPCNVWTANETMVEGEAVINATTLFYFPVSYWREDSANGPMRIHIAGQRAFRNGTVQQLHSNFEFVGFVSGPPPASVFELPSVCASASPSPSPAASLSPSPLPSSSPSPSLSPTTKATLTGAGTVVGSVFAVLIGLLVVALLVEGIAKLVDRCQNRR